MANAKRQNGWLPAIISPLAVLLIWQASVVVFDVPAVLLPSPIRVASAMWENGTKLMWATTITAAAALTGLGLSFVVGLLVAVVFSQSSLIRRSCYPYAIFLQTVPIVAIAPLIVIWMGEGFLAVATIAFIISLFPIIANATDGLLSVPEDLRELFLLNKATRWQTIWHLQLPNAQPRILTGVKIASGAAVLGAVVGEFFAGVGADSPGLGYLIFTAKGQYRIDFLFAAIFLCTVLGVTIFYCVSTIGTRLFLSWHDTNDSSVWFG